MDVENVASKQPPVTLPAKEAKKGLVDVWSKQKIFFKKASQIKQVQFQGSRHRG